MPLPRDLEGETEGHPAVTHRPPAPRCSGAGPGPAPPAAAASSPPTPGPRRRLPYSQSRWGFCRLGNAPGGGKGAAPALRLPRRCFPPAHVARAASPLKKAETQGGRLLKPPPCPEFLGGKTPASPAPLPPPRGFAPPSPRREGTRVTVTEGCRLYWTPWVLPKGDAQGMAAGWEGGEAGTGFFKGLNA